MVLFNSHSILKMLLAAGLFGASATAWAATFVVTTTSDGPPNSCQGECTLREAIVAANVNPTADTINFAIQFPVRGELLFQPTTPLPTITQPVTIDGYSQPGTDENDDPDISNATLRIRLDGALAGPSAIGLSICASNVVTRGLSVTRFAQGGIRYGTQSNLNPCASQLTGGIASGNFLGLSTGGLAAFGNTASNLGISNAVVRVGGTSIEDRNVVSASQSNGIEFAGNVAGSRVENNLIGTDRSGAVDRGNAGNGILFDVGSSNIIVGTISSKNRIAYNNMGIRAFGTGTGMNFFANLIAFNDSLGIDLGGDASPTPNDPNDTDGGANGTQNFPEILNATRTAQGATADMILDVGHSNIQNYRIALYASSSCDASNHGEGGQLISSQLRGLSNTNETFSMSALTDPLPPGTVLTATATAPNGSTSEFSECFFLDPPPLVVNTTADPGTGTCDASECTLREAIELANATPGTADTINFAIPTPTSGELLFFLSLPLPDITAPLTIDGYSQSGTSVNSDPLFSNAILRIRLDGTNSSSSNTGLKICTDNVTIRGLSFTGFSFGAIRYSPDANGPCASTTIGGVLAGNFFGLATDGVTAGSNANGVILNKASVQIGDGTLAGRNLIAASDATGLAGIVVAGASLADIQGNLFGTDNSGQLDRGNAHAGIAIGDTISNTTVGSALSPNLFAFNETGIRTFPSTGLGNRWHSNVFRNNDGLGVDIFDTGINPNDPDDVDTQGGNGAQNFPELSLAERSANGLRLVGLLDVPASQSGNFTISVHANASCDVSGNGEGERLLGTFSLPVVNGSGEAFDVDLTTDDPLSPGTSISTMATAPDGSSSEFSACLPVTDPSLILTVNTTTDSNDGICNAAHCSLREAITIANAQGGNDTIAFAIAGNGPHTIAPANELPTITDALTINGYTQLGASPNTDPVASNAVIQVRLDGVSTPGVGLRVCADDVEIRGLAITRFSTAIGVNLLGCGGTGVQANINGNFIGLAADGSDPTGQTGTGVEVTDASVLLGGEARADRNVISGLSLGVSLSASDGSQVHGNLFGTDPTNALDRGNQVAALLIDGSADNTFGSINAPNRFAFNDVGISVSENSTGNRLFANEFASSASMAIDLLTASGSGVTPNDPDDADAGGNNLQNFPVLSNLFASNQSFVIQGTLDVPASAPVQPYTIAIYESANCSSSGNGEGEILLDAQVQDFAGFFQSFSLTVQAPPPAPGHVITATATDPDGNTSEFSACFADATNDLIFADSFDG